MADATPRGDDRPTPIQALAAELDRARRGEPGALRGLRATLESDPAPWRELGDLAARAERLWIALAAGPDPAAAEALRRRLAALKAELAGPSPTPIERLLADHAAACWLQVAHGDAAVALAPGAGEKLAAFLLVRQDRAQRRFLAALKAVADVRRLLPRDRKPSAPCTLLQGDGPDEPGDAG